MNKNNETKLTREREVYVPAKVEVIEIAPVRILCASNSVKHEAAEHIGMHIALHIRKAIFGG